MKATDIRVSIIVPVYNVEKYLDKCLDSLVHQTLENYEIIVVNDGTKDRCQDIIDRYVQAYPQLVHSYIKENGGLSDARNFGLQYAKGKYISFLDSDDYVDSAYYEEMYKQAETGSLDLVVADLEYVWENGEKEPMDKEGLNTHASSDINKALFLSPLSVCNKLFRRDLFQALQLKFYKGLWYEDIPVALLYCANSHRIGRNTKYKYHYLQRKSSILGSGYSPKMYDIFSIFEKVMTEFKANQLYDKYRDELEYLYIEHFLVYGAFRFLRTDHYRELMSKAFSFVKTEFPHYLQNPYIATLSHKNRIFLYTNTRSTMGLWHKYLCRGFEANKSYDNQVFSSRTVACQHYTDVPTDIRVSIIVPVYNVEKYLDKCLDSLVHQTLENYEIIVVNDGTKDRCQDIIDRYVQAYPQLVHSYIKENGGLSDARNFGLQYAKGKYISFLDSDDYVETDYYQGIFELANKNDLDLVVSDLEYVWENEEKAAMRKEGLHASAADINQRLFLSPLFAWNKLYRRSLFRGLKCQYPKGLWYEDIPVTLRFFANAHKVGYYHHVGVHYLQRKSSILGSGYSPKMYDIFSIFEKVMTEFKANQLYDKYRDELEYLYIEHFLVYGAFRFLRTDHYRELMSKAFSFVKTEFPHYLQNPYIATLSHKNRIFLYTNTRSTMGLWHKYLTR